MGFLPIIPDKGGSKQPASKTEAAAKSSALSYSTQLSNSRNLAKIYIEQLTKIRQILEKPPVIVQNGSVISQKYYIPYEIGGLPIAKSKAEVEALRTKIRNSLTYQQDLQVTLESLIRGNSGGGSGGGGGGGGGGTSDGSPTASYSAEVLYNVSAVKEAYFTPGQSLNNVVDTDWAGAGATKKFDNSIYSKNTPAKITQALDLWKEGQSGKGMIQTWAPPGKTPAQYYDSSGTWAVLSDSKSIQKYGFQFIYNPGNISMSYGGVADVDPAMMSSGLEDFSLINPSVMQSSINFEILINRMFDMKYIGSGGAIKGDLTVKKLWPENSPDSATLKKIYNKGTMYDIEFLLQTMFSYKPVVSQFRGETSDIGYLGAFPVEMHLGNQLRYVVIIDSINVNHVIFTDQMVPIFSTVSISAKRIPDYQAGYVSNAS